MAYRYTATEVAKMKESFNLADTDEIECIKEDARDAGGRSCEKKMTEW